MSVLPFAPLTHDELNRRVRDAVESVGWYAAAVLRRGDDFNDLDVEHLRARCAELDAYQAAALARIGGAR